VIIPIDALLRREVEELHLRFTCESCVHFDESTPEGRCSLGFPHQPHLRATFEEADGVAFCKAFELS